MNIDYVDVKNVKPAEWRVTYAVTPDLTSIKRSLDDFGWLYPIIVRKQDFTIIDGFHRWMLASEDKALLVKGKIPVQWIDCSEITAMAMHIKINRSRGNVVAKYLSSTILNMVRMQGDAESVRLMLGMKPSEFDILIQPELIKSKKLAEHSYSRAWVPVEVPAGAAITVPDIEFERPPTPDH